MPWWVVVVWVGGFGLVVGSFLTVVIARVPEGRSIVQPRSACDSCRRQLTAGDLVPVLSWLVLRGRCRTCGATIGAEAVVVELTTATLFALLTWRIGATWALPAFLILAAALVALSVIDLRTQRLPRQITYTAAVLCAPWLLLGALVDGEPERLLGAGLGAAIGLVWFGTLYVVAKGGFGDGDVRLAPLLGAHLGWLHVGLAPLGLFAGFVLGAIVGVSMMATGRAGRRTALPFGPFMAAGALIVILIGEGVVDLWLGR